MEPYVPMIDISGVDFSIIVNEITAVLPVVIVPVITILALRKGISFVMGLVRGA